MLSNPIARILIGVAFLLILLIGAAFAIPASRQWLLTRVFSGFYHSGVEAEMDRQPLLRSLRTVDPQFHGDVRDSIRHYADQGNLDWREAVPRYRADLTRAGFWRMGSAGDATLREWLDLTLEKAAFLAEKGRPDLCTALVFALPENESDSLLPEETMRRSAKLLVDAFDDPGPPTRPAGGAEMAALKMQMIAEFKHRDMIRIKLGGDVPVERRFDDLMANRGAPPAVICDHMRAVLAMIRDLPPDESARAIRRLMIPATLPQPALTTAAGDGRESRIRMAPPAPGARLPEEFGPPMPPPEPELQPSRAVPPLHKTSAPADAAPRDEALAK